MITTIIMTMPVLRTSKPDLEAVADYAPYVRPPDDAKPAGSKVQPTNSEAKGTISTLSEAATYLREQVGAAQHPYSGYWTVTVVNGGTKIAEKLSISIPNAALAIVKHEGKEPETRHIRGVLDLGEVYPGAEVRIQAWSTSVPDEVQAKRLRVVHSEGLASISFPRDLAPGPYWRLAVLLALLGTSVGVITSVTALVRDRRKLAELSEIAETQRYSRMLIKRMEERDKERG